LKWSFDLIDEWPVWQAAYGIPPVIWWNNLERVMMAVDDLSCRDLFGRHRALAMAS
jgi:hypothetical protein